METVILIDKNDKPVGTEEKLKAHQDGGRLHRAFSIFIFNSKGEMLLQKRSPKKYHFGGLWTNSCCSHPRPGEETLAAARRRLKEEFGFTTELKELFAFTYCATDQPSGLTEWECDHVIVGKFDGKPKPNPDEVGDHKWVSQSWLEHDVKANPDTYTPWFKIAIEKLYKHGDFGKP